jgi:plasmid stabilization system protein ParE
MRVRFLKRAQKQLLKTLAWMDENDVSTEALEAELARKEKLLEVTPYAGSPVLETKTVGVRVLYLSTRHILYYRVKESAGLVEVLSFWHTSRRRRPKL